MNIKETIMHYIDVYEGSEKRIIDNVIAAHSYEFTSISKAKSIVEANISWLAEKKYISVVNYTEMTDMQKRFYESDGYCRIFKIIKRYNENEY